MAAQREDAAARAAHVAEQQLDDRRTADVLHPTECCVHPTEYTHAVVRSRPLLAVTASHTLRELIGRDPADLLDHLGGVAGVVTLEDLKDAERILQGLVAPDLAVGQRGAAATDVVAAADPRAPRGRRPAHNA